MYRIFPELGEALDNLIANRHFWQDALAQELAANEAGVVRPPEQRAEEAVSTQLGAGCGCCVLQVLVLLLLLLPLHGPPSSHRRGGTTHLLNGTACCTAGTAAAGQGGQAPARFPGQVQRHHQQAQGPGGWYCRVVRRWVVVL